MYMERIQQREREKALVASAQEDAQRWAQRMREGCEVEWEVSQSLVSRVREMLATPLEDTRWSPRDVATYSDLASRLSRQAVHEMIDTVEADDGQTMTIRVEYCDLPIAAHSQ
jgi:RNA-splicing ligase RtcB